jgi:hypothetical protein
LSLFSVILRMVDEEVLLQVGNLCLGTNWVEELGLFLLLVSSLFSLSCMEGCTISFVSGTYAPDFTDQREKTIFFLVELCVWQFLVL